MLNFEKLTESVFNAVDKQYSIPSFAESRVKKSIEMTLKMELRKESLEAGTSKDSGTK